MTVGHSGWSAPLPDQKSAVCVAKVGGTTFAFAAGSAVPRVMYQSATGAITRHLSARCVRAGLSRPCGEGTGSKPPCPGASQSICRVATAQEGSPGHSLYIGLPGNPRSCWIAHYEAVSLQCAPTWGRSRARKGIGQISAVNMHPFVTQHNTC
jgi:hypothetical protein